MQGHRQQHRLLMKKSRKKNEGPDADLVTALKSEITKAKAVDTKNYTEESVKVLNDTISEAEKVANDTEATDAQVTSATSDVKAAVENLEEKMRNELPVDRRNRSRSDRCCSSNHYYRSFF